MLDLTREEKIILIFLAFTFTVGVGISAYKKSAQKVKLSIQPYETEAFEELDKFIEEERVININTLKAEELRRLPGVGEKLAERIIRHHNAHGPFRNKEELMQVQGIGEKKFENIKDLIVLE